MGGEGVWRGPEWYDIIVVVFGGGGMVVVLVTVVVVVWWLWKFVLLWISCMTDSCAPHFQRH